jgi:hypothetical protein
MKYGDSGPPTIEDWLALERFDYARVGEHWAVLRLLAGIGGDQGAPVQAKLVVERDLGAQSYPARACALERRVSTGAGRVSSSGLLWRASFALPLETVNQRGTSFELTVDGRAAITLPVPVPRIIDRQTLLLGRSPYRAASQRKLQVGNVKQRVAAFATAVAVTTASTPAVGLAASGTPQTAVATRSHGLGANVRPSVTPQAVELSTKSAANAHPSPASSPVHAKGAPTTPGAAAATVSAPRALGSSPAVGANGQPCLSNDNQPTLANPRPGAAPAGAGLPTCAPPAPARAAPQPVKPHRDSQSAKHTQSAKSHRGTPSSTRPPASNPVKAGNPVPGPATGANGGSALSTPPTVTPPTTAPPTTAPPAAAAPPTTAPPTTGPPTKPGGLSTLGPAPSTLAPPPPPKVHTEPRSAAPTPPSKTTKPDKRLKRAIHAKRPTGGAPLNLGGLSHRPPVQLPTNATGPGLLAPGFSGPQSWAGTVNTNPELSGALSNLSDLLANGNRPPAFLIPVYMDAGKRYHVPWEVLAAINSIETNYGRNLNTSSAGAIGWMQFMPATWSQWGVAVDGHSVANPYDPRDAIFSAARYLEASGAATNVAGAIFSYNHASWYVAEVLSRARAIAAGVHYSATHNRRDVLSVKVQDKLLKGGVAWFNGGLLTHFDRLIAAANMVSAANFPYLYAGGHEQPARFGPFDCSGAVSYVVQQAGYTVPTTASGGIPSWNFPAGPGAVTIFYNAGHTFMRIGDRYFGTSGFARPGGGAGWFDTNKLPASYLATFRVVHLPNLHANSFARLASLASQSGN